MQPKIVLSDQPKDFLVGILYLTCACFKDSPKITVRNLMITTANEMCLADINVSNYHL
jgi:hypothetical protein